MHFRDDDEGSDDDFMGNMGAYDAQSNPLGLSKAELRKNNKPIMEKKRRARINNCLNELKTLILEALKKDPARHTKLEKADILEMTVKHLQTVQRSNKLGSGKHHHQHQSQHHHYQHHYSQPQQSSGVLHKFQAGFADCTQEVSRYISQMDDVDSAVKQRLIGHLSNCVGGLQQHSGTAPAAVPFSYGTPSPLPASAYANGSASNPATLPASLSPAPISMGGMQLIPSRLPTGELALVMPNSSGMAYFPTATPTVASTEPLLIGSSGGAFSSVRQHNAQSSASASQLNTTSGSSSSDSGLNTTASSSHHTNNNNSTTTTPSTQSPPLSPLSSSVSTCGGDDELSSDVQTHSAPATPPPSSRLTSSYGQQTPPAEMRLMPNGLIFGGSAFQPTVQQSQISSTTVDGGRSKPLSVITTTSGSNQRNIHNNLMASQQQFAPQAASKKRTFAMLDDGEHSSPAAFSAGLLQLASSQNLAGSDSQGLMMMAAKMRCGEAGIGGGMMNGMDQDPNGDMWRPW